MYVNVGNIIHNIHMLGCDVFVQKWKTVSLGAGLDRGILL